MPMVYKDHVQQLLSRYPQCEWHQAESLIWQAAILTYNEHPWAFCVKEARITTEAAYNLGTVTLTNNSTAVVGNGDGGTWDPTWILRRFIGAGRAEEYDFTVTGAQTGTLGSPWLGATAASSAYSIFRDTYAVPSDCDYGREYFLLDPARNRTLRLKDLGVFERAKTNAIYSGVGYPYAVTGFGYAGGGYPIWATRVATTAAGVPQLRFGPDPPSTIENYPVVYYASPQRTTITSAITPLFPVAFEDLIWRRARWLYSEEKGRSYRERDDLRRIYYERFGECVRACDGGAEVERYINSNYPAVFGDWQDNLAFNYTGT